MIEYHFLYTKYICGALIKYVKSMTIPLAFAALSDGDDDDDVRSKIQHLKRCILSVATIYKVQ